MTGIVCTYADVAGVTSRAVVGRCGPGDVDDLGGAVELPRLYQYQ